MVYKSEAVTFLSSFPLRFTGPILACALAGVRLALKGQPSAATIKWYELSANRYLAIEAVFYQSELRNEEIPCEEF
jgi:hypothetical protein